MGGGVSPFNRGRVSSQSGLTSEGFTTLGAAGGHNVAIAGSQADQSYLAAGVVVPTNGGSATIPDQTSAYVMDPAGTIATYTLTMPATPFDGLILEITTTNTITALTLSPNANQSIKNLPTTITSSAPIRYRWVASSSTWYRR
jgi:hypothetical protein